MDKTNVKAEFIIIGDGLHPKVVTERLKITPNEWWVKGDEIKGKIHRRINTCWELSTEYEESCDINDQLEKIVAVLIEKKSEMIELNREYDLKYVIGIVVNVENNEKPAMYFNSEFIEFVHDIKAEIDIDLYVFS